MGLHARAPKHGRPATTSALRDAADSAPDAICAAPSAASRPFRAGVVNQSWDVCSTTASTVKAGDETATVAQHPKLMGSMGPATLLKAIQGKKVAKNIDTGTEL